MAKSLEAWKKSVFNQRIDFDNASYDCVDVSKSWIMYLTDKGWQEVAGWGNAKDIYSYWKDTFLERVPRGNAPKLGDIVVMNEQVGGGYGHTGVVVGVDGRNITLYQQNTFTQQPVYTGVYDGYASFVTGYLRPKVAFSIGDTPQEAWQRTPVAEGARYRDQPSRSGAILKVFKPEDAPIDFKGFVKGESVDGNNIWFVGRYTGGYSHSSGYTDTSTTGLPDITPADKPLADNQRKVGSDAMNIRSSAQVDTVNNNVIRLIQPAEVITVQGYVHGQNVDGVDVWFKLDDGNYTWSGGYTNSDVGNLPDLTPKAPDTPQPPITPTYPAPTSDTLSSMVVNKKHPNDPVDYEPSDLIAVGNGQQLRKEAARAVLLMQQAATAEGAGIYMGSGYRSYATQASLYASYVAKDGKALADRYSARAGYSEHQTGLVMDFTPIDDRFDESKQYAWLQTNAHKFGFVLRYPEGKEDVTGYMYEPWHWRYIGVTDATAMKASGKTTLEEYYGVTGGLYADQDPGSDPGTEQPGNGTTDPDDPVIVQPTPDPTMPDVRTAIKTVVVNAVVTFVQAFVAAWTLTGFQINKGAIGGAIGAALSLVWNTILKPFAIKQGWLKQ